MDWLGAQPVAREVQTISRSAERMGTEYHEDALVRCRLFPAHRKIPTLAVTRQNATFETNKTLHDKLQIICTSNKVAVDRCNLVPLYQRSLKSSLLSASRKE